MIKFNHISFQVLQTYMAYMVKNKIHVKTSEHTN